MMQIVIPPAKPARRPLPVIAFMTDDLAGTCDIVTVHPEMFSISRQEIATKLRGVILDWIEENATPEGDP
jgi:hypothetical protein